MSRTPKISIIIPTYNAASFVATTLASALAQTRPPTEVIVVDDASTDQTAEIVELFASSASIPIRLIRSDFNSGGPAGPLNIGVADATGDLIATLDHDDLMRPTKLERQAACWEIDCSMGLIFSRCFRSPDVGSGFDLIAAARHEVESMPRQGLGSSFYRIDSASACRGVSAGCFALTCSSFLFPKTTWEECGGFDERLVASCDYGFLGAVATRFPLGYVDEQLTEWNALDTSLYHQTGMLRRSSERMIVLDRLERECGSSKLRTIIREEMRKEHLGAAYLARQGRDYRGAFNHYLGSMRRGGVSYEAILGLAKLIPHRVFRRPVFDKGTTDLPSLTTVEAS